MTLDEYEIIVMEDALLEEIEESEMIEEDDNEEWEQPCHCHESLTLAECPNHRVNAKMLEYNP